MSFSNDEDGDGLAALFGGITPQGGAAAEPGPRRGAPEPASPPAAAAPTPASAAPEPAPYAPPTAAQAPQYPGLAPQPYSPPPFAAPPAAAPAYEMPAPQGQTPAAPAPVPPQAYDLPAPAPAPAPVAPPVGSSYGAPVAPQYPGLEPASPPSYAPPPVEAPRFPPAPSFSEPPPPSAYPVAPDATAAPPASPGYPPTAQYPGLDPAGYAPPAGPFSAPPPFGEQPAALQPPAAAPAAEPPASGAPPAYDPPAYQPPAFDAPVYGSPAYDPPAFDAAPVAAAPPAYSPPMPEPIVEPPAFGGSEMPTFGGFEALGLHSSPGDAFAAEVPPEQPRTPEVPPAAHEEHPLVRPDAAPLATVFPPGPLLPSSTAAVETPEDLERSTTGEKVGLALAVLTGPIGLAIAIATAVRGARRRGWLIGVTRASLVLAVMSTIVFGIAGYVLWNIRADQIQHAEIAAASAEFCAAGAADPSLVTAPTLGWPAPGATTTESLALMQAWTDNWTALAATSPATLRTGMELLAGKGQTIVDAVTLSRSVDDAANQQQIASVESQSGVAAWYTTYCLEP